MAAPFRFGSVQAALSGIDDGQLLNFEHIAANNGDKRAVLAHALLVRRAQQVHIDDSVELILLVGSLLEEACCDSAIRGRRAAVDVALTRMFNERISASAMADYDEKTGREGGWEIADKDGNAKGASARPRREAPAR